MATAPPAVAPSPPPPPPEGLRVCFRLRQPRPRCAAAAFRRDLLALAASLGTFHTSVDGGGSGGDEPLVIDRGSQRMAFVRYHIRDDARVRTALAGSADPASPCEVTCDGVESDHGQVWTIVLAPDRPRRPAGQNAGGAHPARRPRISTDAHLMFPRGGEAARLAPAKARVIVEGLRDPRNLGSVFRLMGCFGLTQLTHVYGGGRKQETAPQWDDRHRRALVLATARGCEAHVRRTLLPLSGLLVHLGEAERLPVVAMETATGASSLHTFVFPEACTIMVGAEGRGIQSAVVRALRPGFDHFVVVPMCGAHISLNVASALGMALYEYRRQWPVGPGSSAADDARAGK